MQGNRIPLVFRAVRLRLHLRQVDVARRAGVSAGAVSRIERGRLSEVGLRTLTKLADALEIRLDIVARWRGGELDRMINSKHAALAEDVVAWFARVDGWELRPEVSFNLGGERGIVDLLAWHAGARTLLVIELKTELVDIGEMLGTFDRKRRLAWRLGASIGWRPEVVAAALLIREGRTNRRRVASHELTLAAALPDDGRRFRAWLAAPAGSVGALVFVPDRQPARVRQVPATNRRVRVASRAAAVGRPSVAGPGSAAPPAAVGGPGGSGST